MEELYDFFEVEELRDLDENMNTNEKPQVVLPGGSNTITVTAQDIAEAVAPAERVFTRGGSVWLLREDEKGNGELVPVIPDGACSLFENYCRFVKLRRNREGNTSFQPAVMTTAQAKLVLASEVFLSGIFEINGLFNVPFPAVADDGTFRLVGNGYDQETKTLVRGTSDCIRSDLSISEAVELIEALYVDFDFMTESDKARCIANLLTPAFRRAGLLGNRIPMEVSEADYNQSGKTLLQQVKAAVYGDTPAYVNERKKGVGGTDENLSKALLSGRPFVLLDNFRGKLNLTSLESFLTADGKFDCRACRTSGSVNPENYFLGLTSNGAEMTSDLANRSCIVRIRKRPLEYEFRDYDDLDFIEFVKSNHEMFLSAIYSLMRAWVEGKRPKTQEKRHSFRRWARNMDWIVQNFFNLSPLLDGHCEARERSANPQLTFLRQLVIQLAEQEDFETRRYQASDLAEICVEQELSIYSLPENQKMDQDARNMAIGRVMKSCFKGIDRVEIDGFVIRKQTESVLRGGSRGQRGVVIYTFERT